MTLLRELQDKEVAVTIYDLLETLPKDYAERSVRRWLDELAKAQFIEKIGRKRSTKYQLFNAFSFCFKEEADRIFSDTSLNIIAKVEQPLIHRKPVTYNERFLESYTPNRTFYIPFKVRAELLRMGKRAKNNEPAGTFARRIFNRLLIDLSYNSSRLEGNTYSILDTEKLVLHGTEALGKLEEEKIMILNHKEAIRYLVDSAHQLTVSKSTICTLHHLLSDGLIDTHDVGVVRSHEVRIGGSKYMPYSNHHRLKELLELISEKADHIQDPYEQSFFLLIHLSYLQPFIDVNKRTSRLSCNIPLIKNNFAPLSFNDIQRENYISAILAVYEFQEVLPMVDLYVHSYKKTCALYDTTVQSIGVDILRVLYRKQRRQFLSEIILKKKVGPSLDKFIKKEISKKIPQHDHAYFVEDLHDDLEMLDTHRLYGLGVTLEEFKAWKKLYSLSP